jgi:hypothetical protein
MRAAPQSCLAQTTPPTPSAYTLGSDFFGSHVGPNDLASKRKLEVLRMWDEKRRLQSIRAKAIPGGKT